MVNLIKFAIKNILLFFTTFLIILKLFLDEIVDLSLVDFELDEEELLKRLLSKYYYSKRFEIYLYISF